MNDLNASREAYDLHNKFCRQHFWKAVKYGKWKKVWFWKMVYSDTRVRVCSKGAES